jgi:hypothetical protein
LGDKELVFQLQTLDGKVAAFLCEEPAYYQQVWGVCGAGVCDCF